MATTGGENLAPANDTFAAIRAVIFDIDALFTNSEDIVTLTTDQLLQRSGRAIMARSIRAQLMGVSGSTNSDIFHNWANLPTPREQFARENSELTHRHFLDCEPLPGTQTLPENLQSARSSHSSEKKIELQLASGSRSHAYELKTSRPSTNRLLGFSPPERRVLGDDPQLRQGRGKPAPDIYLLALESLNSTLGSGKESILPSERLVFEDSVAGVEAGRRAGMRVVWVPHPDVAPEHSTKDMLAGRNGSDAGLIEGGSAATAQSLHDKQQNFVGKAGEVSRKYPGEITKGDGAEVQEAEACLSSPFKFRKTVEES